MESTPVPEPTPPIEEIAVSEVVERTGPRRGVLLAVAGVLAVVGIGAVVAVVVGRSTPVEPAAASGAFMDSMADGDVLGMLEHLDPGERDALAQPMLDVVEELRRLDVLGEGLDPAELTGLQLSWTGMETVEVRRTDHLAVVDVSLAGMTVDADARELLGGLFGPLLDDAEASGGELTSSELVGDVELRVALVPDGDDWHVSLTHTLAEQIRRDAALPFPGEPVYEPIGSESAEAVLDDLVDAAVALDGAGMFGLLDPRELGPVFTYSDLFAADVDAALDEARVALDESGAVIDLDVVSEVSSDEHGSFLTVAGIEGRIEIEGGVVELSFDDSCLVVDATAPDGSRDTQRLCQEDLDGQVDTDAVLDALPDAFAQLDELDVEPIGLRVVEIDGRWYLSPINSMLRAADSGLEAIEPELLSDLVDSVVALANDPEALFGLVNDLAAVGGTELG